MLLIKLLLYSALALATPPACFVKCINEVAHNCPANQADVHCICNAHTLVNQCIALHCYGIHFLSSTDHFYGTCLEHGVGFQEQRPVPVREEPDEESHSDDEPEDEPEDLAEKCLEYKSLLEMDEDAIRQCMDYILEKSRRSHRQIKQKPDNVRRPGPIFQSRKTPKNPITVPGQRSKRAPAQFLTSHGSGSGPDQKRPRHGQVRGVMTTKTRTKLFLNN